MVNHANSIEKRGVTKRGHFVTFRRPPPNKNPKLIFENKIAKILWFRICTWVGGTGTGGGGRNSDRFAQEKLQQQQQQQLDFFASAIACSVALSRMCHGRSARAAECVSLSSRLWENASPYAPACPATKVLDIFLEISSLINI